MLALVFGLALVAPLYAIPNYPPDWPPPPPGHDVKTAYSWHLLVCSLWGGGDTSHGSNSCESQDYDSFDECAAAYTTIVGARTQQNKTSMNLFGVCTSR